MTLPSLGNGCVCRKNVSERERERNYCKREELLQETDRQANTEGSVGVRARERDQVIMQPLLAMTVHVWVHVHVRASVRVASL